MVFNKFILGSKLDSNIKNNSDSYLDIKNNNLYVVSSHLNNNNIQIYNLNNYNLINNQCNIPIMCNISLPNNNEYFIIKDNYDYEKYSPSDNFEMYSTNLDHYICINKTNFSCNLCNLASIEQNNTTSNYNSGFYFNNTTYLIHDTGNYIQKIVDNTLVQTDFSIYTNNIIEKNQNNYVISIINNNILYLIISHKNIILKININIVNDSLEFDKLLEFKNDASQYKFKNIIYSKITNKFYFIPYNISQFGIFDIETDEFKYITLMHENKILLQKSRIQNFFIAAIEKHGYIYMIPQSYNFILVFNIFTESLYNIIDISRFNNKFNELYKFANAHLYFNNNDKKYIIIAIPNKTDNLGIITYDLTDGAILESDPNFDIISKQLFTNNDFGKYILTEPFDISSGDIFIDSKYIRGNTLFNIYSTDDKTSNIFDFRVKTNITIIPNDKLIALYDFEQNITNSTSFNNTDITHSGTLNYELITGDKYFLSNAIKLTENTLTINPEIKTNFTNQIAIAFFTSNLSNNGTIFEFYENDNENDTNSIKCYYSEESNLNFKINGIDESIETTSFDHFALNINNTDVEIYKNGSSEKESIIAPVNITKFTTFKIGENFNGYLDNFHIFNEILTELEIDLLKEKGIYSNDIFNKNINGNFFEDTNDKTIFAIYQANNDDQYKTFRSQDFLTDNKILQVSINNIYSIENNTVYFIPYNFNTGLLALELDHEIPLLKIININLDPEFDYYKNLFKSSIIVNNYLYLIPYIELKSAGASQTSILFIIYDFTSIDTNPVKHLKKIDIITNLKSDTETEKLTKLFCTTLFYKNNDKFLFFIKENSDKSLYYKIPDNPMIETNPTIEDLKINDDTSNINFSDGCINAEKIYLLDEYGSNIYIYNIDVNEDTKKIELNCNNIIETIETTETIESPTYSKLLHHSNILYLIPYNTNSICIYNIDNTNKSKSELIDDYSINQKLFNGGTIMELNNISYIIMIPYEADKLYMYNINYKTFTYIEDIIFKTNRFTGCTVDLKGNLYMNTDYGDILYYSLSVAKFYKQPRIPVLLKNKQSISFKDLYSKFHTDYVYPDIYNYNNKQIKFSDYFNKGGTEYYTVENTLTNKFIIDTNDIIPEVNSNTTINTSYSAFIQLQSNIPLVISDFKNIRSQRYDYFDSYVENVNYTIDSVNINNNNTYLYYTRKYDNKLELVIQKTSKGKSESLPDINSLNIDDTNPQIEQKYVIDLGSERIKTKVQGNNNGFLTYTSIILNLNKNKIFNYENDESAIIKYVDLNSTYFIENGIEDSIPNQTMEIVKTIDCSINGIIKNGIKITMDDFDGSYLIELKTITIDIKTYGIIYYLINSSKLIELDNPKNLPELLTIEIKENIIKYELYCTDTELSNKILNNNNKKINKLILTVNSTSDYLFDLDKFNDLIYLKVIVIINYNSINIIINNGNSLKQTINIIIYENNSI